MDHPRSLRSYIHERAGVVIEQVRLAKRLASANDTGDSNSTSAAPTLYVKPPLWNANLILAAVIGVVAVIVVLGTLVVAVMSYKSTGVRNTLRAKLIDSSSDKDGRRGSGSSSHWRSFFGFGKSTASGSAGSVIRRKFGVPMGTLTPRERPTLPTVRVSDKVTTAIDKEIKRRKEVYSIKESESAHLRIELRNMLKASKRKHRLSHTSGGAGSTGWQIGDMSQTELSDSSLSGSSVSTGTADRTGTRRSTVHLFQTEAAKQTPNENGGRKRKRKRRRRRKLHSSNELAPH